MVGLIQEFEQVLWAARSKMLTADRVEQAARLLGQSDSFYALTAPIRANPRGKSNKSGSRSNIYVHFPVSPGWVAGVPFFIVMFEKSSIQLTRRLSGEVNCIRMRWFLLSTINTGSVMSKEIIDQ